MLLSRFALFSPALLVFLLPFPTDLSTETTHCTRSPWMLPCFSVFVAWKEKKKKDKERKKYAEQFDICYKRGKDNKSYMMETLMSANGFETWETTSKAPILEMRGQWQWQTQGQGGEEKGVQKKNSKSIISLEHQNKALHEGRWSLFLRLLPSCVCRNPDPISAAKA
jgi:hypothetical protein